MSSMLWTFATLALAASASPILVARDDVPKPAKGGFGSWGGFGKGSGGSSSASSSSSLDGKSN